MTRYACLLAAVISALPAPALAWGYEGHEIVADIARARLTPETLAKVDAILATDNSHLTKHDMASEATWADAYRSAGHRETAQWHFIDNEIDGSANEDAACFNHPAPAVPASAGPEQDCVVDKINEFAAELKDAATTPAERLLALKYLLHFIGDVHQPLHAAENHDRGGNCVLVVLGPMRTANLHAIWDTGLVEGIGTNSHKVAAMLNAAITPAQVAAWQTGDAATWAQESFTVAKAVVYPPHTPTRCGPGESPIELPKVYAPPATRAVAVQLAKAGVRLAWVLNQALPAK